MWDWLTALQLLLVTAIWGGMVFFALLMSPAVFVLLEGEVAGRFIRRFFRWYYLGLGGASALAVLLQLSLAWQSWATLILILVALGFFISFAILMPRINAWRDASLAGNKVADLYFRRYHHGSVAINTVQMILLAICVLTLSH